MGGCADEGARGRGDEITMTMTMTLIREVVFVLDCCFFSFSFYFSEIKCNFAVYFALCWG